MTRNSMILLAALALTACGGGGDSVPESAPEGAPESAAEMEARIEARPDAVPVRAAEAVPMDGRITLTVERLIEEQDPDNCLVMMALRNGSDDTVSAGLFAFDVRGKGGTGGGNMFPQQAEPGEMKLAQVILPGKNCDVVDEVVGGEPACRVMAGGTDEPESCVDDLELVDGDVTFTLNDDAP